VYPLLDAVLAVCHTPEEGTRPFVAKFLKDECPQLTNSKHVRKLLLTVEQSDYQLISDDNAILDVSEKQSFCDE